MMDMETGRLDATVRDRLLAAHGSWRYVAERDAVERRFLFSDFAQAFAFMTHIAIHAEKRDHHPEWSNVYNRVDILLTTHDVGGLSDRDADAMMFIDDLYRSLSTSR